MSATDDGYAAKKSWCGMVGGGIAVAVMVINNVLAILVNVLAK